MKPGVRFNAFVIRITARAQVRPTEDPAKVRQALLHLFPNATLREAPGALDADVPDLARLRELIRAQRIPDTARGQMLAGLSEDGLRATFRLGKQAAAAGRAHVGALGGPLGEIEVALVSDVAGEVERAIYRAAPDTTVAIELAETPPGERPKEEG